MSVAMFSTMGRDPTIDAARARQVLGPERGLQPIDESRESVETRQLRQAV